MPDKTWKAVERRVAQFFGAKRNSLSGGNSKLTRSDSLHPVLFIETKHKKKWAIFSLFDKTEELAKKEGKIPILCLHQKNKKGFLVVMKAGDIDKVIRERDITR